MAFSTNEIQAHFLAQTRRQPAKATRRPSLDDYDRVATFSLDVPGEIDEDDYDE